MKLRSSFLLTSLLVLAFSAKAGCITNASMVYQRYSDSSFQIWANPTKNGVRMTWDFGDGTTGSGRVVYKTYLNQGKYTVKLFLWDSAATCGDTFSESLCFYYFNSKPVFSRSGDTLKGSINCVSNTIYKWVFDDGTFGSGCNISHVYGKQDFYKPILKFVQDTITGCMDTTHHYGFGVEPLDFTKCGFIPDFVPYVYPWQAMPYAYPYGKYNGSKTGPGSQAWRWGDGTSTSVQGIGFNQKTHMYNSPGTYTICHIVIDSAGTFKDSVCLNVKIDSCNVVPGFTYTVSGKQVQFTNTSGTANIEWDIQSIGKSSVSNYKANFMFYGTYKVCLKAYGTNNCVTQICSTINVPGCEKPINNSVMVSKSNCYKFTFKNNHYQYNAFIWDFGDTTPRSNALEPSHIYKYRGLYTVKVIGRDSIQNMCHDSLTFQIYVNCTFCGIVDSLVLEHDTATPYEATLNNFTYNKNSSGAIHRHYWDFGDGTTSNAASPVHTYSVTGRIWVLYIATDTITNCTDTSRITFLIDSLGHFKRQAFVLNIKTHGKDQTSIEQAGLLSGSQFRVYPNPFTTQLVLDGKLENLYSILLYNAIGQEMKISYAIDGNLCKINPEEILPRGLYLLKVDTSTGIEWKTVLRE